MSKGRAMGIQAQISEMELSTKPSKFGKHINYYRLHFAYFITVCLIGSLILYLTPKRQSMKVSYLDALFNVVSATTVTGLVSINPQGLGPFDGVLLMVLMLLGSQIFTSLIPLYYRKHIFHRHVMSLEAEYKQFRPVLHPHDLDDLEENKVVTVILSENRNPPAQDSDYEQNYARVFFTETVKKIWGKRLLEPPADHRRTREEIQKQGNPGDISDPMQKLYLEHDASVLLSRVVILYFIGVLFVGFIVALVCMAASPGNVHTLNSKHLNLGLFSIFTAVSMFANAGFSLANENLIAVRQNPVLLLWLSLLVLMGNTMYAPCLRGIIFLLHKHSKDKTKLAYEYLLSHPRSCYTHLFPHGQTMWLIYTIIAFNTTECFFFFILDWNSVALHGLSPIRKIVVGIFQSISTRNAGANVVNLGDLSPCMLVLYVGLMYVAVYPLYLSRQNSRVKEEHKSFRKQRTKYKEVMIQSQKLLVRDSAYLFIAVFLISLCEKKQIENDGLNFSIFNIIFEVISGYGNVGLSLGYNCNLRKNLDESCTDVPWSLSGKFNSLAKFLVILVMLLGRHRGLPENIDVAVTIPKKTASYASLTSFESLPSISSIKSMPSIFKHASMPAMPSILKVESHMG